MSRSRDYQLDINKLLSDARTLMEEIKASRDRQTANSKENKEIMAPRFCKPDRVKKFDADHNAVRPSETVSPLANRQWDPG
ncbi:hypothetical protein QR680_010357 [Steinernema hermaphroditum]|uniref:Uncharacterized protein n=1 Tax=Steinernema hermaphroditum TaxID=289476 RepID=A0AA39INP7_9BILA|nr:hypothetical protein QR680_010357 [Steinernema hermaphroditum]